ncbi:hypothetical protein ATE84_3330 [Aquimarina sp. MAR_2010_214]|nr:hypothetical protein ATE84_3330 [Aquimarina sp. MAR_2010_214]
MSSLVTNEDEQFIKNTVGKSISSKTKCLVFNSV